MTWIKTFAKQRGDDDCPDTKDFIMLLDIKEISANSCGETIRKTIMALDPTAQVTVQADAGRVRVEGVLTDQQAIDALAGAGYSASSAAPHSGEDSKCCGGCS